MSKLKEKTGLYNFAEQKVQYMTISDDDDTTNNSSKWNNVIVNDTNDSNKMIKNVMWIASFSLSLSLLVSITLLCTGGNPFQYQSQEPIITVNYNHITKTYEARQSVASSSSSSQYMRKKDDTDKVLATGTYIKNYNNNGWNHITVEATKVTPSSKSPTKPPTSHGHSDNDIDLYVAQMEAIGMIEGYSTCNEMNDFYVNYYSGLFDGGDPMPATISFLVSNHEWMKKEADKYYKTDDYWLVVKGILAQLKGLVEGLKSGCPGTSGIDTDDEDLHTIPNLRNLMKRPSIAHLLLLNANGDLYQIAEKFHQKDSAPSKDDDNDSPPIETSPMDGETPMTLTKRLGRSGRGPSLGGGFRSSGVDHCSVLIKLLDDRSDTVFAHNTWDDFQCAAPRIIKHYTYPLMKGGKNMGTYDLHFSSSPGFLSSVDDFFVASGHSKFFVTETTFDLYNEDMLQMVQPESMLSWARARLANELASSGAEWADIFTQYHSGTYDNEWMVLDFSRFREGMDPADGFLYVIEEVPGYVHSEDMTQKLISDGYWASYNNPYFDDIREISGNEALCRQDPNYCHDSDPRAKIFKEHQHEVVDIDTMKSMIAYNHWQTDPLSNNDSCSAIACRQDLEPIEANKYPFGATDAKVSSVKEASKPLPSIYTRLGPTHDNQPPFCWDVFDEKYRNLRGKHFSHEGHPQCFDFNWEVMPPR